MKKCIKTLLSLLMVTSLAACGSSTSQTESGLKAGTFTGVSSNGMGGDVEVAVTFTSEKIEKIEVTKQNETPGKSDPAIEKIPQAIVENQSIKVDTVSGATVTSKAIIEAVTNAIQESGNDVSQFEKEVEQKTSDEVVELSATVVIAGAGAAGYTAALTAYDEGAESVIVVEKEGTVGGNAIVSGGFVENTNEELRPENNDGYTATIEAVLAAGPQNDGEKALWDQLVKDYEDYKASGSTKVFDSDTWFAIDLARIQSSEAADTSFQEMLRDFDDWFAEKTGAKWKSPTAGIVGYSWPRWSSVEGYYSGVGFFHYYDEWIKKENANIKIMTDTPMTDLIVNDAGEVTGLVATGKDGTTYNITAEKGVIIATGGYAANTEMVKETDGIWGDALSEDIITTNSSGDTGDGLLIAEKYGAVLLGMENTMLFPLADVKTGSTEAIVGTTASALIVNKEGKRFVDETKDRYTISGAMLNQTDKLGYIISSSENCLINDGKTQGGVDVEKMLANGELYKADTLEELATLAGIDYDALTETIETYNKSCETYVDEEFGRTTFEPNSAIGEGPYYAYPCTPASHITMGGVLVTPNAEVLNSDNEIIKGLYAAGEVTAYNCGIDGSFPAGRVAAKAIMGK